MIVKNEEQNLAAWLPQARPFLDEIVVVDTGSQDATIPLLLSLNATVIEQAWAHDFAFHRNHGLDHVRSEWILILDADERLPQDAWHKLNKLITNPYVIAYSFNVKNYHSQHDLSSFDIMSSYRLFRNGHNIRYTGVVHNQLSASIEAACSESGLHTMAAPLMIEHYGYALSEQGMRAKQRRIYQMVKKQLALTPNDTYYRFHLLNICLAMGHFAEAKETLTSLDFEALRPELRIQAFYKAAQVSLHENAFPDARSFIHKALQISPNASFLHYLRSNIMYQMQKYKEGLRAAFKALELAQAEAIDGPHQLHLPLDECLYNVAMGYLLTQDYKSAENFFKQTQRANPEHAMATHFLDLIQSQAQVAGEPISNGLMGTNA